jgi:hypothetical protein
VVVRGRIAVALNQPIDAFEHLVRRVAADAPILQLDHIAGGDGVHVTASLLLIPYQLRIDVHVRDIVHYNTHLKSNTVFQDMF